MTVMEMMTLLIMNEMMTAITSQVGETKILELEEELRVVANNLKSLEVLMMMIMMITIAIMMNTLSG